MPRDIMIACVTVEVAMVVYPVLRYKPQELHLFRFIRDLVNESIERFFVEAYDIYCKQMPESDYLKEIMEKVLPGKVA